MKWSTHLETKQYLITQLQALPILLYVYFVAVAVLLGVTSFSFSIGGRLAMIVFLFVLMLGVYSFLMWRRLQKMWRLAGTNKMEYELTAEALRLQAGKDIISVPLDALRVHRVGKLFVSVKRIGTRAGIFILFFDDQATLEQAQAFLRQHSSKT
jgi:hypothetical protein